MRSTAQTPREKESLRRLDDAARAERRRRYLETSMAERLETAFELSDLSRELRAGMLQPR